ncbi:uncharacterized protein PRCAT00006096001 [Priceomyces carsonii]|uniref:uncharacterized protein n=1 Tax=Priceomyces carsonii TaxID=28549 RepID=UPI002EDA0E7F|nr:unnamed protein product [Priceomyces carsonii]
MAKLDQIIGFVNTLDSKANSLMSCMEESQRLMDNMNNLNEQFMEDSIQFEAMSEVLLSGNQFLRKFHSLNERSFYLEATVHITDRMTNSMSLDNLRKEYEFVKRNYLEKGSGIVGLDEEDSSDGSDSEIEDFDSHEWSTSPTLGKKASIMSLKLKPIRCSSTKVSKKKSRYRLSTIYSLNPVAGDEVLSNDSIEHFDHNRIGSLMDNQAGYNTTDITSPDVSLKEVSSSTSLPELTNSSPKFNNASSIEFDYADIGRQNSTIYRKDIDRECIDLDESTFSETSQKSSEKENDDFIDFEKFLRRSRVDLNKAFPIILRSKSHESIFDYEDAVKGPFKFHNPVQSMQLHSSNIATPTVEPIYFNYANNSPSRDSFADNPRKLLNEVIMKNRQIISHDSNVSPLIKKERLSFQLLEQSQVPSGRRHSLDLISRSLTDNFRSLMNSPTCKASPQTPDKIKLLKKRSKHYPISIQTDEQLKRLPLRIHGAHSYLTIGPNKTKIIKHGLSSLLRKPLASQVKKSSLHEALSQSLID